MIYKGRLKNAANTGRPATTTTKCNVENIRNILQKLPDHNEKFSPGRLVPFSLARVLSILKKHLQLRKINVRWIPYLLTAEQKRIREANAKN